MAGAVVFTDSLFAPIGAHVMCCGMRYWQTNTLVQTVLVTVVMAQQYFDVAQPEVVLGLRYAVRSSTVACHVVARWRPGSEGVLSMSVQLGRRCADVLVRT